MTYSTYFTKSLPNIVHCVWMTTNCVHVWFVKINHPSIIISNNKSPVFHPNYMCAGEKQAATHVSLDQEYDQDLAAMWCHLEEQLVAAANRGTVPVNFQPTQCCLNSQTDNQRNPVAVVEGKRSLADSGTVLFKMIPRLLLSSSLHRSTALFLPLSLQSQS